MTDDYQYSACYDWPVTDEYGAPLCYYSRWTDWWNVYGYYNPEISDTQASILDPCLSWYENGVCARCKFGSVRIFNGNGIYCGYKTGETSCEVSNWHLNYYDIPAASYEINNRYYNHTSSY